MTVATREFPVKDWDIIRWLNHLVVLPVMPNGSIKLLTGDWVLPSGEKVRPVATQESLFGAWTVIAQEREKRCG